MELGVRSEELGVRSGDTSPEGESRRETYYIMKNSWGTGNAYRGYILVSEQYVRMKTIAVYLPSIVVYGV